MAPCGLSNKENEVDNQHRKISGYRELSAAEIDLMNRVKAKVGELLDLQKEVANMLVAHSKDLADGNIAEPHAELARIKEAEPMRWAAIAKTDIQTGGMALVRAIAQPAGV